MDFDTLWTDADGARATRRFPLEDIAFVREVIPTELESFPQLDLHYSGVGPWEIAE
jgi:hypothetical protein